MTGEQGDDERERLRADLARGEGALRDGRLHEADGIALDLLARRPGLVAATALRGLVANARDDAHAAAVLLAAACAASPDPGWLTVLANLHRRRFRLDEALAAATAAVSATVGAARLAPLLELARIQLDRDRGDEAAEAFLAALAIDPDHPAAHLGLGQILLARGEWAPGWLEYEWRNRLPEAQGRVPPIKGAAWNGMRLPRGRLLVICDQGFGDAFQFARFLPEAAGRVRELVLAASPEIAPLLARLPGVARCHEAWRELPPFSAYALLSSLPGLLRVESDAVPAFVPYLAPDRALLDRWAARLAPDGRRRVAIFWSGRPSHPNNSRRSLGLDRFAPVLAALGNARVVSVQKERSEAEAAVLAAAGVLDAGPELATFDDTAALLAHVDLLVTVDSAVAHLAGATGRPVALLVPTPADWRWGREGNATAWYPGVTLHRQPAPGDWDGAIASLVRALGAG